MNPTTSRRSFLRTSGAAASALALCPAVGFSQEEVASPGRLLILGGTRFLGPELVRAALAEGWNVTLFNRGRSNPEMFKELDQRKGDRDTSDYASLAKGEWDLVIDTSCYIPGHVTAAIAALKGRIGHYVVISTLSVYAKDAGADGEVTETSKVGIVEPERLPEFKVIRDIYKHRMQYYGPLKALCEAAAEEAMPGASTAVRPGLIVGPGDTSDRYTYWPLRMADGGEVLAPGRPETIVPFIDVRDLAPFAFSAGARRLGGVFNAVGYDPRVTMEEVIASCVPADAPKDAEDAEDAATLTWVDDDFLLAKGLRPRADVPLWEPGGRDLYDISRAREAGLTFRDLRDTADATRTWHRETRKKGTKLRTGISREREAELLKEWRASR